jgi:beta-glucosidase
MVEFNKEFVFGAATASYQIEGACLVDGKGLSIWDNFCAQPGKIFQNHSGDIACDHYHRFEFDVQLMSQIGLKAYRFSISWPRVIPNGIGKINSKGLSFYDRLIDTLLTDNIQPWITLFHWDYPQALFKRGGWLNRESADWFADYTRVVVDKLSDRVCHWINHTEPQCFIGLGHQHGQHAPGLNLPFNDVLKAAHIALLGHGKAVQAIRAFAKKKPVIGTALAGIVKLPASESLNHVKQARRATFTILEKDVWNNTWFSDPMIFGCYPEDGLKLFGHNLPVIQNRDLEIINQPLDFFGVNLYFGHIMPDVTADSRQAYRWPPGKERTDMGWQITPEVLYWGPKFFYERYKLPIVITENGMANCDWKHLDGKVHDPQRIDFLKRYLRQYNLAIEEGVEAKGYFVWSIMDNFEWNFGYEKRFGLIYVDYSNQKRILKDSAYWYKKVIQTNGQILFEE